MTDEEVSLELRRAFAAFPTGVVAVCALGADGEPIGMAVNSFTSISLSPPLVAISVANTSRTWPLLAGVASIGLTVLAGTQERVSRQLSARTGDRFDGVKWGADRAGAVHLDGGALWLTCHLENQVLAGDHMIVLLSVDDAQSFSHVEPLVFHHSRYRAITA